MDFKEFMQLFDEWQSKPHMFVVNNKRVQTMECAYDLMRKVIHEYTPDAKIEINMSVVNDGSASISVETDEIVVHNVHDFISIISEANNFEIYPLNNGNIKIAIMFNGIMDLIR